MVLIILPPEGAVCASAVIVCKWPLDQSACMLKCYTVALDYSHIIIIICIAAWDALSDASEYTV